MGGRGSSYSSSQSTHAQATTPSGFTLTDVQAMDDQQLHDFLIDVNKTDIPAFLNQDIHLQKMVYALGMNDTPEIVDSATFQQLTSGPGALEPIYRTVNDTTVNGVAVTAQDICDMLTDGDLTYVGNGIHGDGLYFSNDLVGSKAYGNGRGSKTVAAVLNKKANVISERQLKSLYDNFVKNHPQSRKALGFVKARSHHDSMSQFALTQGYNVITSSQGGGEVYYTVLDRSVLTMTRDHY